MFLDDRGTTRALLEAVSRSVTGGVWLTELKQSFLTVQLDGRASSLAAIADLIHQLGTHASFARGPEVRTASVEDIDRVRVLRFQVIGELAPSAGELVP